MVILTEFYGIIILFDSFVPLIFFIEKLVLRKIVQLLNLTDRIIIQIILQLDLFERWQKSFRYYWLFCQSFIVLILALHTFVQFDFCDKEVNFEENFWILKEQSI